MKWYITRAGLVAGLMLMVAGATACPEEECEEREERRARRHQQRLENYQSKWNKLIPQYHNLQFAGSIGLFSLGVGWDYGRKEQWETEIMFGLVPQFSSNKAKVTFTLKQNYVPWEVRLGDKWWFEPLEAGLYMNTLLSNEFWVKEPDKYPSNYYKFSTRIRFHACLGQRVAFDLGPNSPFRRITAFYELSTCDLYLISAFTNRYVKAWDILSLSFGIKFHIL